MDVLGVGCRDCMVLHAEVNVLNSMYTAKVELVCVLICLSVPRFKISGVVGSFALPC